MMGRRSRFNQTDIFAAAGAEVVDTGRFTLQNLSEVTGISTGSIYHRYDSRQALLAEAWLDALVAFQTMLLSEMRRDIGTAADRAALVTPRFARANFDQAVILACARKEEFVGPETPTQITEAIAAANGEVDAEFHRFARAINRPLLACRLAIAAYPLAAVRLYLPKRRVPESLDVEILRAVHAALS
jgi:AcrR family transcriptional regulator